MEKIKQSGELLVGERPARKELEKLLEKPLTLRPSFLNFPPQSSGREDRTISPLRLLKQKSRAGVGVFCRFFRAYGSESRVVRSAHVAQLAEHVLGKDEVIGSIPIMGSKRFNLNSKQN